MSKRPVIARSAMTWRRSNRFDPAALPLADRHYNRQKPGTPQFVPPGRCLVLLSEDRSALWVTSWPKYVRHSWPGAWINTLFRNEGSDTSSWMIRLAVAHTRAFFGEPPEIGMITFVDPGKVKSTNPGYCYLVAGFIHEGWTAKGLRVLRMPPDRMPEPEPIYDPKTKTERAVKLKKEKSK